MNFTLRSCAIMMLGFMAHGCKKGEPPIKDTGIIYGLVQKELSYNKRFTVDLNGDQRDDLYFSSVLTYDGQTHRYLTVNSTSTSGGKLQLDKSEPMIINGNWAQPLKEGDLIQASPPEDTYWSNYTIKGVLLGILEAPSGNEVLGPWRNQQESYVGVQLQIADKSHFGWLRVTHKSGEELVTIVDYAYNTAPLQAIEAGQKSN